MNRTYAERRHHRFHKAMRRIREDRGQHGSDRRCSCFELDGRTFSLFADSMPLASPGAGQARKLFGPSRQELRGPRVADWE